MKRSFGLRAKVWFGCILSSVVAVWFILASVATAHEVLPSIADMTRVDGGLDFALQANLEGFVAGIDLDNIENTDAAPQAEQYDALRALDPVEFEKVFRRFWPEMAEAIVIRAGNTALLPELVGVDVPTVGNVSLVRPSVLRFRAQLPQGAEVVEVGWAEPFGVLVLRQQGVEAPYDGYLPGGTISPPIQLGGGGQATPWEAFTAYIPVGFEHIIPLGLDHILFVLALFFLAARLRPLIWQVSAFTLAHTVTLAAGALGYVNIPSEIVEPVIAASIVYVAIENIFADGLNRTRPLVVFGFGLLHGLGFASVLEEFGVPEANFIPALVGFNVGVEFGQLAVIAVAFITLGYWFRHRHWYRPVIAIPASAGIALVGAYWFVERVFL